MSKKPCLSIILASLVAMLAPFQAYSYYFDSIDKVKFQGFNGDGSFVEDPAYVGDCFGYVLLGVLLAAIISEPVRLMNYNETSDDIGVFTLKCCTKPFGVLFGGFPWMIKKAFWDFPIILGGGKVPSYKPAPAPELEVPPQLIEPKKTILNEDSAVTAIPTLAELMEPAPLPQMKIDIPSIPAQLQPDTAITPQVMPLNIPQAQNVPQLAPLTIPAPQTNVPSVPVDTTTDQTLKSTPKTWEGGHIPDWLNKDLAE